VSRITPVINIRTVAVIKNRLNPQRNLHLNVADLLTSCKSCVLGRLEYRICNSEFHIPYHVSFVLLSPRARTHPSLTTHDKFAFFPPITSYTVMSYILPDSLRVGGGVKPPQNRFRFSGDERCKLTLHQAEISIFTLKRQIGDAPRGAIHFYCSRSDQNYNIPTLPKPPPQNQKCPVLSRN
jgi:hypothetical protein